MVEREKHIFGGKEVSLSKKVLAKTVFPGTWILVKWDDSPVDLPHLVVQLSDGGFREPGQVDVCTYDPRQSMLQRVTHEQIVGVGPCLDFPCPEKWHT